ncbi:MAG: DUF2147 domain-containing protein [Ramlibacter sp.]|nr:DUF2147 domain-containing protein [Ramlibacter sp.]
MKLKLPALLAATALTTSLATAQPHPASSDPTGRWITESGNLEVELAPCGAVLCGTVVRVLGNRSMSGSGQQPMVAADPRPALGMVILSNLKDEGAGEYFGTIYNRENAKTYKVRVNLGAPDRLVVHPYIGLPLFGQTQQWRRADPARAVVP